MYHRNSSTILLYVIAGSGLEFGLHSLLLIVDTYLPATPRVLRGTRKELQQMLSKAPASHSNRSNGSVDDDEALSQLALDWDVTTLFAS